MRVVAVRGTAGSTRPPAAVATLSVHAGVVVAREDEVVRGRLHGERFVWYGVGVGSNVY